MRQESGFTLIELIVVIVILGILAAFAVPRFVGMQDEARRATIEGLQGSLQGAASLGHGKQLANQTKGANDPITVQGQSVAMEEGWPADNSSGIHRLIQDTSGFSYNSTDGTFTADCTETSDCIRYYPSSLTATDNCYVDYGVNATSYYVNATTSGC